jgi:hypothetical protein
LDCVDVHYNYNTKHVDEGEYKRYMRVKTCDGKIMGEIEEVREHSIVVAYKPGFHTGWNSQMEYSHIELDIARSPTFRHHSHCVRDKPSHAGSNKSEIIKLDNGLNSPWKIERCDLAIIT